MKLSVLIATFAISFSSLATTLENGVKLSNLPTATKSYHKFLEDFTDRVNARNLMKQECLKDKAAAEAFIVKSGSKVLTSTGCNVYETPGYADQGGYRPDAIETNFEVVFK